MILRAELSGAQVSAWNRRGWTSLPEGTAALLAGVGRVTAPGSRDSVGQCQLTLTAVPGPLPGSQESVRSENNLLFIPCWVNQGTDVTGH